MNSYINYCRLYLKKGIWLVNSLDVHELHDTISESFGFQIQENDVFSTKICKGCIDTISSLALYKSCVLNNQEIIARRHALESQILELKKTDDNYDVICVSSAPDRQVERSVEESLTQFSSTNSTDRLREESPSSENAKNFPEYEPLNKMQKELVIASSTGEKLTEINSESNSIISPQTASTPKLKIPNKENNLTPKPAALPNVPASNLHSNSIIEQPTELVNKCTNNNYDINNNNFSDEIAHDLPQIVLHRICNQSSIKLFNLHHQEVHYTNVSNAMKSAVRKQILLLIGANKKPNEMLRPNKYTHELLNYFDLSPSLFGGPL